MGKPGRGKHASYEPGEVSSVDEWLASGAGVSEVGHGSGRVLSGTRGELAACLGHLRDCASCAAAWPQNIPSGRELIMQLVAAGDGGEFGPAMAGHMVFALSRPVAGREPAAWWGEPHGAERVESRPDPILGLVYQCREPEGCGYTWLERADSAAIPFVCPNCNHDTLLGSRVITFGPEWTFRA